MQYTTQERNFLVIGRAGDERDFDGGRIERAIERAFGAVARQHGTKRQSVEPAAITREVIGRMVLEYPAHAAVPVEAIQDLVEEALVNRGLYHEAKAFILYRARHGELRGFDSAALDIERTMDGYLGRSDWRVNENANVNYSLGGLILHNSGAITANYWLNRIYTPEVAQAHRDASFHIHDLSMFSGYCAGWSLRQLIAEGLGGVRDKISSAPARHLNTLVQQMVNFLGIMQNEWAGAQAFSSFDTCLAPFVREDRLDYAEVKQAMQSFIYGVNTPSRWGSQAPFTNITLDWIVPSDLAGECAVVGGETLDYRYGDLQAEMDMINRAILELMNEGDASGRGFQYPIPTYNITDGFAWDTPNAELLFALTAKYGTPYFQNFVNSDLDPSDVRSMCCRLRLDKRELRKRGGGLFGSDEFTGSIGVVTINLPQIAFLASGREDFFARLDDLMELASESLETKRRVVTRLLDQGLFPYTKRYLGHLDNHFATIGIVGMNEAMRNLEGKDLLDPDARVFAVHVLDHMRERMATFQERTGSLYNLEASPAEGASYRLALHDRRNHPGIVTAGTDDAPYYTNSSQLPVNATVDIFDALDLQDDLQTRYTGGTVFHGFLGEQVTDWRACAELVRVIARSYRLPYFTISPTFSVCTAHGYLSGAVASCPTCGAETEVYSRIVGYYRALGNWNTGKRREFGERTPYDLTSSAAPRWTSDAASGSDAPGDDAATGDRTVTKGMTAGSAPSRELFVTPDCPRCPAVKSVIGKLDLECRIIDATTEAGAKEAAAVGVMAVPTLVERDALGRETWRSAQVNEITAHLHTATGAPEASRA